MSDRIKIPEFDLVGVENEEAARRHIAIARGIADEWLNKMKDEGLSPGDVISVWATCSALTVLIGSGGDGEKAMSLIHQFMAHFSGLMNLNQIEGLSVSGGHATETDTRH